MSDAILEKLVFISCAVCFVIGLVLGDTLAVAMAVGMAVVFAIMVKVARRQRAEALEREAELMNQTYEWLTDIRTSIEEDDEEASTST